MKKTIPLVLLICLFTFCSQEKKLLRQAANSVERTNYENAIANYDQILQKNPNSFFGNAGKGVVLSEFMGRHEQAIPYLETALKNTPEKTKPILQSNLGKSYHFMGNYERALFFYSKSQKDNDPKWGDYDAFLSKRIADCKFAIEHPKVALPENQHIVNLGTSINSEFPEYTPVLLDNKMYYTSKRQDSPKEKKNGIDGKYYEAIYVAEMKPDGSFEASKRYTVPNSRKAGEALMSISPNGKKMFIYKGGKIYESDIDAPNHQTEKLDEVINFSPLQNHASLSPDGKTLYFTSDSEEGRGGTDIYVSTKKDDGSWSDPKSIDMAINTEYDEDAPFVNESGTLFFSSNGHPGYGGFDVYKSSFINGSWTKPENIGQPINSPGDDIYFTLQANSSYGYYSSARPGGHGDLDLYKVHYVSSDLTPCQHDDNLVVSSTPKIDNNMTQNIQVKVPEKYIGDVRSYRWDINGQELAETGPAFTYTFPKADTYVINAQLIVYCDSCPTLQTRCAQTQIVIEAPKILTGVSADQKDKTLVSTNGKTPKGKKGKIASTKNTDPNNGIASNKKENQNGSNGIGNNTGTNQNNSSNENTMGATNVNSGNTVNYNNGSSASINNNVVYLTESELLAYNWNTSPEHFDLNQSGINSSCKTVLDQNISVLKSKPELNVVIIGHADSRGSDAYNKALSIQRAKAVKQYMIANGVEQKRIKSVTGSGETNLLNNCADGVDCSEEQHQVNRRVQVNVMQNGKIIGTITSR